MAPLGQRLQILTNTTMPESTVFTCNNPKCSHPYQDSRYGQSKRVFNPLKKSPGTPQKWRCTVCGNVIEKGEPSAAEAKAK